MDVSTWRNPLLRGMSGNDVGEWQGALVAYGYLTAADSNFGPMTEKATIRFQVDRGLVADGRVGPATVAAMGAAPHHTNPPDHFDPRWRLIQATNYQPANRIETDITLIPLHSMESPDKPDTAEGVAAWFAKPKGLSPEASAHANVDMDSIVLSVRWQDIAWGVQGANSISYNIEQAGYAKWSREEWLKYDSMLALCASHAKLALEFFELPKVALTDEEVAACIRDSLIKKGTIRGSYSGTHGGLCEHRQCTRAWQKFALYGLPDPRKMAKPFWPTHTDCGDGYPIDVLLEKIDAA